MRADEEMAVAEEGDQEIDKGDQEIDKGARVTRENLQAKLDPRAGPEIVLGNLAAQNEIVLQIVIKEKQPLQIESVKKH